MTKTQIDRLGDRLKKGNISDDDLRLLDSYRRTFSEAYEIVVGSVRKDLALEPTGRPAKSTTSIADKLRRESIRLTQIQDIAGCRLIAPDIANQELVVQSLKSLFDTVTIVDRREKPSHGYRAVHVIVNCQRKIIEIQVRTVLQQLWAELSEKLSDVAGIEIKYGAGDKTVRELLTETAETVTILELLETKIPDAETQLSQQDKLTDDNRQQIADLKQRVSLIRRDVFENLRFTVEYAEIYGMEINDLSD